ncbi:lysine--tRNA ligase [Candidatus Woesearchaeota archaeon]|nr:lysine--tRNA ligase [Candidatus Woesearchaeota archaeon]
MSENTENEEKFGLFWADQLANRIITREKFRYVDRKIEKFNEFTVKTSASISGVLHIGRLSDTVRGATAYRALTGAGVRARLIWVAEDMDPLRKVPEGVPESYSKYIGFAVTDIPDPESCHESYAEHHKSRYFEVLDRFVSVSMERYSTRAEYRKGSFRPYIRKLLEKVEYVKDIQDKYRTNPLKKNWCPWTPICENCGKIVTAQVTRIEDGIVHYTCKDYLFESTVAEGCSHRGEDNPDKGNGKLLWKGEWAAEWAFWKVCCEGAGKEYIVPNSAFWVNAEIAERIFGFPSPEPLFYEHLMIKGVKMSASLGNVIYPGDWLEVASPQLLSFFYNKRLMKTRSFSWQDMPQLYDEYDEAAKVYFGLKKTDNEKEDRHIKRLYELSNKKESPEPCISMSFSHAVMISQLFTTREGIVRSLTKTGHYDERIEELLIARVGKAKKWVQRYAPEAERFELQEKPKAELGEKQRNALGIVSEALKRKEHDEKGLSQEFYAACKSAGLEPKEFFRAAYMVLLNRDRGPRLAPFVLALGDKATRLFEEAAQRQAK